MAHVLKHSADWFTNDCASQVANMHFFGNIWWWEINDDFLSWYFREVHFIYKLVDFLFNKLVLNFDLKETFFIWFNRADNIIVKVVFYYFFSELDNSFTAKCSAFLFIFVHIEVFHGIGGNIFTLIFGAILDCDLGLGCWEGFLDEFLKFILDQSGDKFGLGLHIKVDRFILLKSALKISYTKISFISYRFKNFIVANSMKFRGKYLDRLIITF